MTNAVSLKGNVVADAEYRAFPNGGAIATFRIATSESWRDKATGEQRNATEYHNVVLHGNRVQSHTPFIKKGVTVRITKGKLKTRKFADANGGDKYVTEVHCEPFSEFDFIKTQKELGIQSGVNQTSSQPQMRPNANVQSSQQWGNHLKHSNHQTSHFNENVGCS